MIGIVLSGGQSTRMGVDKGLITMGGQTWAELAFAKLGRVLPTVFVSVNNQQKPVYEVLFSPDKLIVDVTDLNIKGPLMALLSCHLQYPTEEILVLACDMPCMDHVVLELLVAQPKLQPGKDCYLFFSDAGMQPLPAIYTPRMLSLIYKKAEAHLLEKHSVKYVIENSNPLLIPIPAEWEKYFTNFNTSQEAAALNFLPK